MKMRDIKYIVLVSFILLLMNSCTERIDVDLDTTYTRLVVEGHISTDTVVQTFRLTKTAGYFSTEAAPPVLGAQIRITDQLGNQILLEEKDNGFYQTDNDFYGEVNKSYELQIDLKEEISGQEQYLAQSDLPAVQKIDSIGIEFNEHFGKNGFWIVKLYAQDPGEEANFYMFNVYKNGKLMTDTLNKVSFTDDKMFNGNYTHGIGVVYFRNVSEDQVFKVGDEVVLQMSGITKEHYIYMNEVLRSTSFQNPMFGGPPANVKGNLSDGAFGFFSTYSNTYCAMILTEDNIEYTK